MVEDDSQRDEPDRASGSYEPPSVRDIDTTDQPAFTVPGVIASGSQPFAPAQL